LLHCNLKSFSFIFGLITMRASTLGFHSIFAASLICTAMLSACKPEAAAAPPEVIRPVKTMIVGSASTTSTGSYSAEIRPRVESQLAFRVGGKVIERLVDIGAVVKKDQVLMRLDPSDLQLSANAALAQVAAAKANDDVAQATLKRSQDLAKQNFISAGALDQAIGAANASRAALAAAQANSALGANATQYGVLRADADGVVTALSAEVGQVVAAGTPVLKVSAGAGKDVVFAVPEGVAGLIKRGTPLEVQLWAKSGSTLAATVRDVSAIADSLTRTYAIKASLSDVQNAAPLGSTATVAINSKAITSKASSSTANVLVPIASVVEAQGKVAVWVVEGGMVKKHAITLAASVPAAEADAVVAVTSGLASGAVIVTAGVHTLTEGQKVRTN
jgi:membrane fusion protein, multidrug efflux system